MAAYVWSIEPLMRLGFLLCSRGFENKDDEEEEEDAEYEDTEEDKMSEENTLPPQSDRQVSMQREHAVNKNPSLWTRKESLTGHWWEPSTRIFELWRGIWIPMGTLWSRRRRQRIDFSNASGKVRHGCHSKNPPPFSHLISFGICCVEHPLFL
jgi:hypothetical protein